MWNDIVEAIQPIQTLIVGVIATLATLRKVGIELDKKQKQAERRKIAEVGGEVLTSTLRFLTGLATVTDARAARATSTEGEEDLARALSLELRERWHDQAEFDDAFTDAWDMAEVYLPLEVVNELEQLWKLRASIYAAQDQHIRMLRLGAPDPEVYLRALGPDIQSKIDDERAHIKGWLRPVARSGELPAKSAQRALRARIETELLGGDDEAIADLPAPQAQITAAKLQSASSLIPEELEGERADGKKGVIEP